MGLSCRKGPEPRIGDAKPAIPVVILKRIELLLEIVAPTAAPTNPIKRDRSELGVGTVSHRAG